MDKEKAKEALNKIRGCVERDACERTDCVYYAHLEELTELVHWIDEVMPDEKCENVFVSGRNWEAEKYRKEIFTSAMVNKGVTAREIAKKFDITEVTLWRIINGDTQLDKLKEIGEYLGLEVYIH